MKTRSNDEITISAGPGEHKVPAEDPPFSHGFLDNDPETSKARPFYFKMVGGTVFLILTYVIWAVLPIYWASVFKLYDHAHHLHGWIVVSIQSVSTLCVQSKIHGCLQDHDGGAIGQTVAQTFIGGSGPITKMTWTMAPSNLNLTTREQFEHAMVEEKAWAIVTSTPHTAAFGKVNSHVIFSQSRCHRPPQPGPFVGEWSLQWNLGRHCLR